MLLGPLILSPLKYRSNIGGTALNPTAPYLYGVTETEPTFTL